METQPAAPIAPQSLDDWFLNLLRCPGCEQHAPVCLNETQDAFLCACGRYSFPILDGIPILLVESATVLDATARPEEAMPQPGHNA